MSLEVGDTAGKDALRMNRGKRTGRLWAAFLLSLFLFLAVSCPARAVSSGFSTRLSQTRGREGDTVDLTLSYDGSQGEVGAFLVRVEYDPKAFQYRRTKTAPVIRDSYSLTECTGDSLGSGYTMKSRESCLTSPGEVFTYRFQVLEGAPQEEAPFSISVYQTVSPDGKALPGLEETLSCTVLPPPSEEAYLSSLTPDAGTLEPAFSPEWFDYELTVPFSVASLTFSAEPAEGAVCKVNRKNLGAGGSDTEFLLTVTAEDRETKNVYRVTAHREEKTASPKPSPTPKATAAPDSKETPKPQKTVAPAETASSGVDSSVQAELSEKASPIPMAPEESESSSAGAVLLVRYSPAPTATAGEGISYPPVVVRSGEPSWAPLFLGLVFAAAVFAFSRPLAKWICWKLPEKKDGEGDKK